MINVYISYLVKLAGRPVIGVFYVHSEQEAKDIAMSYFNNIPTDTNKIIHYNECALNIFPNHIVHILKNINSEAIYITDVIVSNKYVSATISEGMRMTVSSNNGVRVNARDKLTDDNKDIITSHLKIYPILEANSKDDHKEEK